LPDQARLDAQATLQAVAAINQQQTAVAQQATQQAVIAIQQQQTIVAQATQAAQATQSAVATSTAVSAIATAERREEDLHMLAMEAERLKLQETRVAGEIKATLEAALVADQQARMMREQQLADIRMEQERIWLFYIQPVFIAVAGFIFIVATAVGIYGLSRWFSYRFNPVHVVPASPGGVQLLVNPNFAQFRQLTQSPSTAVPLPLPAPSEALPEKLHTPSWTALTQFLTKGDGTLIPLGVTRQRRPVIIDRNEKPHLAVAAATGAGKTTSVVVPYIAALAAQGVHVLIVNGRGSDFGEFANFPNITITPRVAREHAPARLNMLLQHLVAETDRRDKVLAQWGVRSWYELPPEAQETGEIAVVIDEYLSITDEAKRLAGYRGLDRQERDDYAVLEQDMWHALKILTREARKFGIYIIVTMTDPTAEQLGKEGMGVRRQMVPVAMRMNSGASSRAFLDANKGTEHAQGTVGLPTGEFLCNLHGRVVHAAGFYPRAGEVRALLASRPIPPNPLPLQLTSALSMSPPTPTAIPATDWPQTPRMNPAETDGRLLAVLAEERNPTYSLNQIALFLIDRPGETKASQQEYERAAAAITWRLRHERCNWAAEVVRRSKSGVLEEARSALAEISA
jgi:hypothetical protein